MDLCDSEVASNSRIDSSRADIIESIAPRPGPLGLLIQVMTAVAEFSQGDKNYDHEKR